MLLGGKGLSVFLGFKLACIRNDVVRDGLPLDRDEDGGEIQVFANDTGDRIEKEIEDALIPSEVDPLILPDDDDEAVEERTDIRGDQLVHDDEVEEAIPVIAMIAGG